MGWCHGEVPGLRWPEINLARRNARLVDSKTGASMGGLLRRLDLRWWSFRTPAEDRARFALPCRRLSPPCRRQCPSDWSQPGARRCRPMLVQAVRWATHLLRRKLERHPEHAGEPCLSLRELRRHQCDSTILRMRPNEMAVSPLPLLQYHCNCHQTDGPTQTSRLGSPIRYLASLVSSSLKPSQGENPVCFWISVRRSDTFE
jgi:hypothetical protein